MACISVGCFNLPCSKTIKGNVVSCKKECIKMGNIDKTDNYINKCICLIQVLSSEYSRIKVGQKVEVKIKVNKNHEITAVGNIISLNNNNMVLASFMLEHERALYEDMLDKKTIRATAHIFIEHFLLGESIFNSFRNLFK